MTACDQAAMFEHRFWLQVLGDHARFIWTSLYPSETREVRRAERFVAVFDTLTEKARASLSGHALAKLSQEAFVEARRIRAFKLHLLRRHLRGDLGINISATFLNHMANEVEEYLRILTYLIQGQIPPPAHPVHHHLLWLLDAAGHAAILNDASDPVDNLIKLRSLEFRNRFEAFYLKAVETAGYLRTSLSQFPALNRFNHQVELEMRVFQEFLHELEELEVADETLGTITPLMPDHMARETCYYLTKLAESGAATSPACDPDRPRREEADG